MSTILKYTLLVTLSAYVLVNAVPTRLKECELATMFLKHGFNQYQARFSICYAKSKNYVPKVVVPFRYNETSKAIFFFGMFPITTPFCGNTYDPYDSLCGISCKYTPEYSLKSEVLCMKHVFETDLSEEVLHYMKLEEGKLSDCMRTILDDCRFNGPGGSIDGQPIFLG